MLLQGHIPYRISELEEIYLFSQQSEKMIRNEFEILKNYYENNPTELLDQMIEISNNIEVKDYYSEKFKEKSDNIMSNKNNKFHFNDVFLLNSSSKIYAQLNTIPAEVRENEKSALVYFFNLSDKKSECGSYLILSALKLYDWREFIRLHYATNN